MRNFILDNTNEDNIIELIGRRKEGAYVMPLYAKMYHDRIDLRDIDEITNFNPSGFKLGFGAVYALFEKPRFPIQHINLFDVVYQFKKFDEEMNIAKQYYVIESSNMTVFDLEHPIFEQINYYYDMFSEHLSKQQAIRRKKLIDEMMNS